MNLTVPVRLFVLAALMASVMFCSRPFETDSIGAIAGENISQDGLFAWISKSEFVARSQSEQTSIVWAYLDSLVIEKEINRLRSWEEPPVQAIYENWRRSRLRGGLYQRDLLLPIFTEERLQRLSTEVQVEKHLSQIRIPYRRSGTTSALPTRQEALSLAEAIVRRASTDDFAALARQYGQLPSVENGESQGKWYSRWSLPEDMAKRVWRLKKGEVTEPYDTGSEVQLFKVNRQRRLNDAPKISDIESIGPLAAKIWEDDIKASVVAYQDSLLEAANFRLDTTSVTELFKIFKDIQRQSDTRVIFNAPMILNMPHEYSLGEYSGIKMDKLWLHEQQAMVDVKSSRSVNSVAELLGILTHLVGRDLLFKTAVRLGFDQQSQFLKDQSIYQSYLGRKHYLSTYLREAIIVSEESLLSYYYQVRESQFAINPLIRTRVLVSNDSIIVAQIYADIQGGQSLESAAAPYGPLATLGGVTAPYEKGAHGILGAAAFGLQPGGVSHILSIDGQFHLVQLMERLPAQYQGFSEVRKEVEAAYRSSQEKILMSNLALKLRQRYQVSLNAEYLENNIAERPL